MEELYERHIPAGGRCLDLGCGDGLTSGPWLRDHGRRHIGVDISEQAVAEARKGGYEARRIDDAGSLPFPDASFDAVVAIEVFEHLFEPQQAAREALRVLRPGGVLVATVPNVSYWRRRVDLALLGRWNPLGDTDSVDAPWRDPHLRFFNRGSLHRMLTRAGFDRVSIGGHGGAIARDVPLLRNVFWRGHPSALYRATSQAAPGLLAYRLHAVAFKPWA